MSDQIDPEQLRADLAELQAYADKGPSASLAAAGRLTAAVTAMATEVQSYRHGWASVFGSNESAEQIMAEQRAAASVPLTVDEIVDAMEGDDDPAPLGLPGPSSAPCAECDTPHGFGERCARASGEGTAPQPDERCAVSDEHVNTLRSFVSSVRKFHGECSVACRPGCAMDVAAAEAIACVLNELTERGTAPQVPAEVLWEGPAGDLDIVEQGRLYEVAPDVDVDARVRVVAADGAPQEGDERG